LVNLFGGSLCSGGTFGAFIIAHLVRLFGSTFDGIGI
jgi:hypothetical protein